MANTWVTGGAGYIRVACVQGAGCCGHTPVTFDNLVTRWRDAVNSAPLYRVIWLKTGPRLMPCLKQYQPSPSCISPRSVRWATKHESSPATYWRKHVEGVR